MSEHFVQGLPEGVHVSAMPLPAGSAILDKHGFSFDIPIDCIAHSVITLNIKIYSPSSFAGHARVNHSALSIINYFSKDDKSCLPEADLATNKNLGPIRYLNVEPGSISETEIDINPPSDCSKIRVQVIAWDANVETYLIGRPSISAAQSPTKDTFTSYSAIAEIVEKAAHSKGIILLYTTAPTMGHKSLGLRPNRMAREYQKLGWTVVFFPFGRVAADEIRYSDRIYQFTRDLLTPVMESIAAASLKNVVYICSSFPDVSAIAALDFARLHRWTSLYEVRDEMEEFNRVGYSTWYRTRLEAYMCRNVDHVTTVSQSLLDKMIGFGARADASKVIPNAVEASFVEAGQKIRALRPLDAHDRRVGYIGHLTTSWFDWNLVLGAAKKLTDIQFEIIGHGAPDNLQLPRNVTYLGPKTHAEFMDIAQDWHVGLIPFKPSRLTKAVDPNKLFEYLAVGLRVVSAEMGSVDKSPMTSVYRSADQFSEMIKDAVNLSITETDIVLVERYLSETTWDNRAIQTLAHIGFTE